MRIRIEVEPNDIVRMAQATGKKLDYHVAAAALRKFQPTIERVLEDAKKSLLRNVLDYALHGEQLAR